METEYSERSATTAEEDRGKALQALAGEGLFLFLIATFDEDGNIKLKLEAGEELDGISIKRLLEKTLAAMP